MQIRIAIVEDEYFFRLALKKYIAACGERYVVCGEADNGLSGLALLRAQQPDIALVDITMPVMDGIEMIQRAVEEGIRAQIVILTGYSAFEYARSALQLGVKDYLLKPLRSESLRACLEKLAHGIASDALRFPEASVKKLLREQLAEQLTRGDALSIDADLLFEYLNFPKAGAEYCAALLQCEADAPAKEGRSAELLRALEASIREELDYRGLRAVWYAYDAHTICLVAALEGAPPDGAAHLALYRAIEDDFCKKTGARLFISIGAHVECASQVQASFLQARAIQYYHLFRKDRNIAAYTGERPAQKPPCVFGVKDQQRFYNLLRTGTEPAVRDFLRLQFERLERKNADANAVYLCIAGLLSAILEFSLAHAERGAPGGEAPSIPMLFSIKNLGQLREFVTAQALGAMRNRDGDDGAHKSTIQKVNAYIEENYADPGLCLEEIARIHLISIQYLCTLYRKHMDMTIGDYIFNVRMARAEALLRGGTRSVSEVARRCGYNDIGYFGKCFKKKFGVSPRQYPGDARPGS